MAKDGKDLLYEITQGSSESFEQFYDRYAPFVFGIAMKLLKNKRDAEDLVQDVFIEIYNNPQSFDPSRGSVEAWVAIKTKSRCLDLLRKKKQVIVNDEEEIIRISTDPQYVEEQVIKNIDQEIINKALKKLPAAQREAIYQNYYKGMSHREVATQLNRPLGTVKSLIRYGIKNMRKYFMKENV